MKPRLEHPPAPNVRNLSDPGPKPAEPEKVGPVVVVLELFGRFFRALVPPRDTKGEPLPMVPRRRTLSELCDQAEAAAEAQEAAEQQDPGLEWISRRVGRRR